ncbi:MAG: multidrug effflux MFS transporter [Syntrophobacteraceae bacterium]|nr:multidrug effflux MFS transporter [Syntrophobacteraceae bacterium]
MTPRLSDRALLVLLAAIAALGPIATNLYLPALPAVREHFGAQLETEAPAAFRAAHRALFDWFRKTMLRDGMISQEDLVEFEQKVDEMALLAFNVYSDCRERLYELRVNEVKNRSFRLLQRADLLAEIPESERGSGDSDA